MTCTLCGLDSGNAAFCCAGCQNVHAILLESGVIAGGQDFRQTELFQQSLALGLISRPDSVSPPVPPDAPTAEAVFQLSGLWCTSCGWLIEHALARTRGIVSSEVVFASDLLRVRYCPQYLPTARIAERVESLGYRATEYTGNNSAADSDRRDLLLRTGIAAFLSMNVMTLSVVLYAGYFERISPSFARYLPLVLMVLATPSVFYCARPILRIAFAALRERVLRMESLLAMGILTAYFYSAIQSFRGTGHVYFDTACAIVTLVLTGKSIERAAKERTTRALSLLYRLMPNKARVLVEGRERFVSLDALQPGMLFRVKSGERIPADGRVEEGRSHADESVLTGESAPRPKSPGDSVISGSLNTGGVLEIRATRVGGDSTLARIVRNVEQAARNRTRVERTVDRVSRIFIPFVLLTACATFVAWQIHTGHPADALMHAIAVLVIACPCALGVATPLALHIAVTAASRRGILVSDARVLETIRNVDLVVLDKTGTATFGEFTLLEAVGDISRMAELAALECRSEHPIGDALVAAADRVSDLPVSAVQIHTGMGISGMVGGTLYFIGNRKLAKQFAGPSAAQQPHVYFGWDGQVRGSLIFGDRIRPETADLCASLRAAGIRTLLLSGDSYDATHAVAEAIGADNFAAEATPERKAEIIREQQIHHHVVAMIGDGVNDAPSLVQADLGIALGSGADIAIEAAPLVLANRSLASVIDVLQLARRVFTVVRLNLFWAFIYNIAGITLAIVGVLNPIMAAGAMVLSSVSVIANSRRLANSPRADSESDRQASSAFVPEPPLSREVV
jgi:Cu2+-exporting ATPase